MNLRLLTYNIRVGGVGREKVLASAINSASPDVVVLEEATRPDVVERLAAACGMKWWGAHLADSLAYLSRVEVAHAEWHNLALARRRYVEIVPAHGPRIFGVHLSAIHSNVTEQRRMYELRALLRDTSPHRDEFHLLAGDFNTLAEGAAFDPARLPGRLQLLYWLGGGRIRWRALALLLEAKYSDAYRLLHPDPGYSFPTWDPQVRLDYVFLPSAFVSRVKECRVLYDAPGAKEASDHFPLFAEIAES